MAIVTLDDHAQCVIHSEVNQRPNNEDSMQVLRIPLPGEAASFYLLAVADGMGGHAHGEDVSQEGLRKIALSLLETLTVTPSLSPDQTPHYQRTTDIYGALQGAIEQANFFLQRMIKNNRWEKAGSTLVLALVEQNYAWVVNLGDSPLFHWRAETQQLEQVTENHTVTNVLVKGGKLNSEMAAYHHMRNVLDLYLGCEELPEPLPFYEVPLDVGDRLLLCSDGISGDLSLEELEEILGQDTSLEEMGEQLIQKSQAAGSTDNQTLILWEHPELPPRKQWSIAPTTMTTLKPEETIIQA